jgi:fructose-1,6-bisphosphatase-3
MLNGKIIGLLNRKFKLPKKQLLELYKTLRQEIQSLPAARLESELARVSKKLSMPLATTQYAGDFHGQVWKFTNMLTRRFGLIYLKIYEKFPQLNKEKKAKFEYIVRTGRLQENYQIYFSRKDVIENLKKLINARADSLKQYEYIEKYIKENNFSESIKTSISNILHNSKLSIDDESKLYNDEEFFACNVKALAGLCRDLIFGEYGKIKILGDIIDRGAEPDLLVKELIKYEKHISFIWGNHDVLWMGAAAGHPSLIAEALRISFRYNQTDFIEKRMGFDFSKLYKLAEQYGIDKRPDFNTKNKNDRAAVIEKVLFMIQSKLEHAVIERQPDFGMSSRLYLKDLAGNLKQQTGKIIFEGQDFDLQDSNFPTLDLNNPYKLSKEEKEVIDDLVKQFRENKNLKEMISFLFKKGQMYEVHNGNLLIHANVPSTKDGKLAKLPMFENKAGKELYDYLHDKIKEIGERYARGEKIDQKELDFFVYLWCGIGSPLFDKDKMATAERYWVKGVSDKEGIGRETSLYWAKNMENEEFIDLLSKDFSTEDEIVENIIQGHTPKDPSEMKNVVRANGRWMIADQGWTENYPGHSIVETSKKRYLVTINLTKEQMKDFEKIVDETTEIDIKFAVIKEFEKQREFKDIGKSGIIKMYYELLLNEKENRAA